MEPAGDPSAAAATVRGEVVRIAGRLFDGVENSGGINCNADCKRVADAFASGRFGRGASLGERHQTPAGRCA